MTPENKSGFYGLGLAPKLLEALDRLKFTVPTPIQEKTIPSLLEGKDIMGIAQTGTGKTLAFGLPMIQRLAQNKGSGLVIVPTRELALQVEETLLKVGRSIGLKTALVIGGASMGMQVKALRNRPHVVIGTPGRLNDHIEKKTLNLSLTKVLVLDEADRMLDMGFAPQIEKIVKLVPKDRQTMLFSATMPAEIIKLANSYMQLPIRVEIEKPGTAAARIKQEVFFVKKEDKAKLLEQILTEYKGPVLVFSRTKHGAVKIMKSLKALGHTAADIHSNRSLGQRKVALEGFKTGRYRILVATDIAARGIDVTGIELVVNYDLPEKAEDYVHRIGRTGRAGHEGNAISFATPDQARDVRDIEKLMRSTLPVSKHEQFSADLSETSTPKFSKPAHKHHRSKGRGHGKPFGGSRRKEQKRRFVDFTSRGGSW